MSVPTTLLSAATLLCVLACSGETRRYSYTSPPTASLHAVDDASSETIAEGREIFRHETFGDEGYWTDTARLHEVLAQTVSPRLALKLGLRLDAEALPAEMREGIRSGTVDLDSPATTVALLELDAIVGLQGTVTTQDGHRTLTRVGMTCALCHSTVDDSFAPGIGFRRDGWPNRELDVGALLALTPAITPDQRSVYNSWGPGRYDPRYNLDGNSTPLVVPPLYGLARVENATCTADGPISYWNAFVAVTQMHGLGNFHDQRLDLEVRSTSDLVQPQLAALRSYQHSLETPRAPVEGYDISAVERGRAVFSEHCASCHVGVTGTDDERGVLHEPSETGMDRAYAQRTANKRYRTTPLRGLWQHAPYFHDGSAATLGDVVEHYDRVLRLKLDDAQKRDMVAFLETL